MELFEKKSRSFAGPSGYNENQYDYYNRSARKDISLIRTKLNEWFDKYPENVQLELKNRFKKDFDSAFYELTLFSLFIHLGFDVTVHPPLLNSNKRPDFLIVKDTLEVYIEAKVSKDQTTQEEKEINRANEFYDGLNKLISPNFLLYIEEINFISNKQPRSNVIVKFLNEELKKLDPDLIQKNISTNSLSGAPRIYYKDNDIELIVKPIPVIPSARNKTNRRPIGMMPIKTSWGGPENTLRNAIEKKTNRYGNLDKPFIICINGLSIKIIGESDILDTIYGSRAILVSENPPIVKDKWIRKKDGTFLNNKGAKHKNLSGILITKIFPFSISSGNYWLFEHPFSNNKLDFNAIGLEHYTVKKGEIIKNPGKKLGEIFEIPEDWLKE